MNPEGLVKDVWIVEALRTPIGASLRSLKDCSAAELGAVVIKEILKRTKVPRKAVEEVVLGNAVSAGTGQNLARQAAILAGLPVSVPGFVVNNVCGSGLQAVILGAQSILCGHKNLVLTGGTESASKSPGLCFQPGGKAPQEIPPTDSLLYDGLMCSLTQKHMGQLMEHLIKDCRISREKQDQYSLESHRKVTNAWGAGKLLGEVVAVPLSDGGQFTKDERPRKNITKEILEDFPPAFAKKGTVTAGNSSVPSDGAACLLLSSSSALKDYDLKAPPKAGQACGRLLGYASIALEPHKVFAAGVVSIRECLRRAGLSLKDIDLFEISEAFAAQALLTRDQLKIPEEKMNVWGGDIALGHPLGAAGARILVTLLHALRDQKKKKGVACVCLGGGGGVSVAVEAL